jgi:hypothetical protein
MDNLLLYSQPHVLFFSFEESEELYMRIDANEDTALHWYHKVEGTWVELIDHDTATYEKAYQLMLVNATLIFKQNLLDL